MSILLCECDGKITSFLDLQRMKAVLQERGEQVFIRRRLCGNGFEEAVAGLKNLSPLAVGACRGELSKDDCRAELRRAGFDPFSFAIVPLLGEEHESRALALLAAAVDRLKLFPGAREGNLKPRVGGEAGRSLSRRQFFNLPRVRHDLVPYIDQTLCASVSRLCRLCVKACLSQAIMAGGDGRALVDKEKCTGCGECVAACPAGAITYPSFSPAEIVKEIEVVLTGNGEHAAPERRAVVFACEHRGPSQSDFTATSGSIPDGLYPVMVPCLSMLNAAYFVAALAAGADGVALIPCGQETCRKNTELATVKSEIALANTILRRLDYEGERIMMIDRDSPAQLKLGIRGFYDHLHAVPPLKMGPLSASPLRGGNCSLPALLIELAGSPFLLEGHPSIPLGDVRLDKESACTFCGVCTKHCPTGALAIAQEEAAKELRFTYGQCVGCGECAGKCPEKNLRITKVIDTGRLSGSCTTVLGRESSICCGECGKPFLNKALFQKIKAVFSVAEAETVLKMCPDCREKTAFSSVF